MSTNLSNAADTTPAAEPECAFCRIAHGQTEVETVFESASLLAFLDHAPIRPGHVQVIPKAHFEVFDDLPPSLAAEILHLGQRLAKVQKRLYGLDRIGFVFSGHDVTHAHAHVIPLHEKTDLTSLRYFALGRNLPRRDIETEPAALKDTADQIAGALQ